jgi:hypothetical protein
MNCHYGLLIMRLETSRVQIHPHNLMLCIIYIISLFQNETDRSMMVPALCKGATVAVFTPDRKIAASALSFVECSSAVVVFFLATETLVLDYWNGILLAQSVVS